MRFSIIVVCLNSGERLRNTIESVTKQTFTDYEIVIKDGLSGDGSTDAYVQYAGAEAGPIRFFAEKDTGIYDAMNQAVGYAKGEYLIFMNCGDYLQDELVLEKVNQRIAARTEQSPAVVYGNLYQRSLGTYIYSYSEITPFTCYRNVPCHQTCFYHRDLFTDRGYDCKYIVRADYEHFLYCYFTRKAEMIYLPEVICSYEGEGFSETREHLLQSKREHKEITKKYMSGSQLFRYRSILLLTLQPLRTRIANSKHLSGWYNAVKSSIYKR